MRTHVKNITYERKGRFLISEIEDSGSSSEDTAKIINTPQNKSRFIHKIYDGISNENQNKQNCTQIFDVKSKRYISFDTISKLEFKDFNKSDKISKSINDFNDLSNISTSFGGVSSFKSQLNTPITISLKYDLTEHKEGDSTPITCNSKRFSAYLKNDDETSYFILSPDNQIFEDKFPEQTSDLINSNNNALKFSEFCSQIIL